MAVQVDIKALLEAGVHFGHKTSRWHPKMAPFIHSKRQDSHIIDLTKTVEALETVLPIITESVSKGKQVLLVGTKRQAQDLVRKAAETTGQPFVTERWMGGMLTNVETMVGRIKHLKTLEKKMDSGELANRYNKLEVQRFQEEIDEMNRKYGGIKDLDGKPGVVFVTDIMEDINAVREAKKLGVPVIAICDTNTNPGLVDYAIPANDDAIKGLQIIIDYVVAAIEEGKATADKKEGK
ncbi:MAG: 30S ribosomal protein S2 [Candidatus Saccharimonadales bacterium]